MVGMILTGHGKFASGLTSSIELIAGPQENWAAVDFQDDVDKLTRDLTRAMESMKDLDGILVFCDLAGGSPFKTAAQESVARPNVAVIAGTNLPMLAEMALARKMGLDLETLASSAICTGKDQVVRFDLASLLPAEDEEDNLFADGI